MWANVIMGGGGGSSGGGGWYMCVCVCVCVWRRTAAWHLTELNSPYLKGIKEMFYLMTHSKRSIYSYMVSDIW